MCSGRRQRPGGQWGTRGAGPLRKWRHTCPEGGGEQRLGLIPGNCSLPPENPLPTYAHPLATTVALRPPIGRVLGVTVVCPLLNSTSLAVCRRQCGEARGAIWSEFAAGSSRVRRFRGGNDGPGSRQRPASQVEWSVLVIPADSEGTRYQASAWFAGTSGLQRFLEGLDRLPGGSLDSKS